MNPDRKTALYLIEHNADQISQQAMLLAVSRTGTGLTKALAIAKLAKRLSDAARKQRNEAEETQPWQR